MDFGGIPKFFPDDLTGFKTARVDQIAVLEVRAANFGRGGFGARIPIHLSWFFVGVSEFFLDIFLSL